MPNIIRKFDSLTLSASILLGFIIVVAFHPYGVLGLTYDSHDILAASKDLHTYLHGRNQDGHSYLVRAPLHPIFLSFFGNKVVAMWWVNLSSILASLVLVYKIARINNLSANACRLAVLITGIFTPWLINFMYLWTEPVFIVFVLLLCYALLEKWSVTSVIVICVILFLTRKAGLFFFAAAAATYLLEGKRMNAASTVAFGVFVFILWEWLEFTYGSTGYIFAWIPKLQTYSRVYYVEAVTSWFLPLQITLIFRVVAVALLVLSVLVFFSTQLFGALRQRQNVVLLTLASTYVLILVSFRGISEYEDGERYLTVVFPFLLIFSINLLSRIWETSEKPLQFFICLVIGLWLTYISLRLVHYFFWPVV